MSDPLRRLDSVPIVPPGIYTVAVVDPGAVERGRVTEAEVVAVKKGVDSAQVEAARGWIDAQNRGHDVLMRPQDNQTTLIGLRGVEPHRVRGAEALGYEPALVLVVGDRRDLLFKAHAVFNRDELTAARALLADLYGVSPPQGVFRDAVHLPATRAHVGKETVEVELISVRYEPFSASRQLLAAARQELDGRALAHRAERLAIPGLRDERPAVVLADALAERTRPRLPAGEPLAALQAAVDQARGQAPSGDRPFAALGDLDLLRELGSANEGAKRHVLADADPLVADPAGSARLVALEGELASRLHEAEARLMPAQYNLGATAILLEENRSQRVHPDSTLRAAVVYRDAVLEHGQAERAWIELRLAQLEADRARLSAALEAPKASEGVTAAYAHTFERWLELALLADRELELNPKHAAASTPAERVELTVLEHQDTLRQTDRLRAEAAALSSASLTATEDPDLRRLFEAHARDLLYGRASGPLQPLSPSTESRLIAAAECVLYHDLSPATLRQAANAVLVADPNAALAPRRALPLSHEAVAERYEGLRASLRADANHIENHGLSTSPRRLERFFSQATEMVRMHQYVEYLERRQLGLSDPPTTDEPRFPQRAVAWVERALERGLAPHEAAAHLANRPFSPTFLAHGTTGPTFALSAARAVAQKAHHTLSEPMRRGVAS